MHTAGILSILMLDINGVNMGMLVLVVDLINLVLKEFVIVAFLVVHDADYQQDSLYNDTLDGAEKGRSVVTILQKDASHAQSHQGSS